MYTANTMSSVIEALGMSLPYSASTPAELPQKRDECFRAGQAMRHLLEHDIKPLDILTRKAFENAMTIVMALGGSTNAVLHLIAMARAARVPLAIDDFQTFSNRVPYLADLRPSGRYVQEDLHRVGGTPGVMKYLLEHGYLHGDCLTVTGKTVAENLAELPDLTPGQDVIRAIENPIHATGHIRILRGSLAPDGAVAKITGKEGHRFHGPARVYDSEEDMLASLGRQEIKPGDVVVIRYEGPKGGPGMPEMLTPTSAIVGAGLADQVALRDRRPLLRRLAGIHRRPRRRPRPRTVGRSPGAERGPDPDRLRVVSHRVGDPAGRAGRPACRLDSAAASRHVRGTV